MKHINVRIVTVRGTTSVRDRNIATPGVVSTMKGLKSTQLLANIIRLTTSTLAECLRIRIVEDK